MGDVEKDWHERSFRASGAINGCQNQHRGKTYAHASSSAISGLLVLFVSDLILFALRCLKACCCESAATDEREEDHKYEN